MAAQLPIELGALDHASIDKEVLRAAMIAELDAISQYEQMSAMATNQDIVKVLNDVIREEKTHVGEFQTMLLSLDKEQKEELNSGRDEVEEIIK